MDSSCIKHRSCAASFSGARGCDGNSSSELNSQFVTVIFIIWQTPQEMGWLTNPWRCPRLSGLFSSIAVAGPREQFLRITADLTILIPWGTWDSSHMKCNAEMLPGVPVLWSTHWCPVRHGKDFCPEGRSDHSWKSLRRLQGEQIRVWVSPRRCEQSVGQRGDRFCSHAQEIANHKHWNQEGLFP